MGKALVRYFRIRKSNQLGWYCASSFSSCSGEPQRTYHKSVLHLFTLFQGTTMWVESVLVIGDQIVDAAELDGWTLTGGALAETEPRMLWPCDCHRSSHGCDCV